MPRALAPYALAGWMIVMSALTLEARARAADPIRVAVVHVAEDEPARRLRAETAAVGFDVVDVRVAEGDTRSTLAIARDAHVVAVLSLRASQVEVLILDTRSDEPLYRDVVSSAPELGEPLSVRAVELLRARLVKLQLVPGPSESSESAGAEAPVPDGQASAASGTSPPESTKQMVVSAPPVPPADERPAAPSRESRSQRRAPPSARPKLLLGGALAGETSSGGLGSALGCGAGAHLEATERWGASVTALIPISSRSTGDVQGSADVSVLLVGALLHYAVVGSDAPVSVEIGLGGGAAVARMAGHASDPALVGRVETVVAGAALADAALLLNVTGWLRLRAEMLAGVAAPRPVVRFDGRTEASWGRPFGVGLLGAEIDLLGLGARP